VFAISLWDFICSGNSLSEIYRVCRLTDKSTNKVHHEAKKLRWVYTILPFVESDLLLEVVMSQVR